MTIYCWFSLFNMLLSHWFVEKHLESRQIMSINKNIIGLYKENAHIVLCILGFKISFKNPTINQLEDHCCIANLNYYIEKNTFFPHPIGIVINKSTQIGNNCSIYQNVTIGDGRKNPLTNRRSPIIGNNVTIYANSVVVGGITIGDNAIIGAGSVVINDVEADSVVAGNPAKRIK